MPVYVWVRIQGASTAIFGLSYSALTYHFVKGHLQEFRDQHMERQTSLLTHTPNYLENTLLQWRSRLAGSMGRLWFLQPFRLCILQDLFPFLGRSGMFWICGYNGSGWSINSAVTQLGQSFCWTTRVKIAPYRKIWPAQKQSHSSPLYRQEIWYDIVGTHVLWCSAKCFEVLREVELMPKCLQGKTSGGSLYVTRFHAKWVS